MRYGGRMITTCSDLVKLVVNLRTPVEPRGEIVKRGEGTWNRKDGALPQIGWHAYLVLVRVMDFETRRWFIGWSDKKTVILFLG